METEKQFISVRKLTITAMFAAVAAVLMFLDFSIPALIPGFVKMDISELPALIVSLSLGPVYGVAICLIKNLLNLVLHGSTGGIGELCNFLLGAAFVGTAGILYARRRSFGRAAAASVIGALVMALVSVPVNYFISYPVYAAMFGGIDKIIAAYQAIRPGTDGLMECLLIFNLPFTFVKGLIDTVLLLLLYRPLKAILGKEGLKQRQNRDSDGPKEA